MTKISALLALMFLASCAGAAKDPSKLKGDFMSMTPMGPVILVDPTSNDGLICGNDKQSGSKVCFKAPATILIEQK